MMMNVYETLFQFKQLIDLIPKFYTLRLNEYKNILPMAIIKTNI